MNAEFTEWLAELVRGNGEQYSVSPVSLWKWLEQALADVRLERDGEGRPHKPFRYCLCSREKHFFPDLPDLEPPPNTLEITDEEYEYFQKVIDQGNE